jgi:hypothetical protein
MGAARGGWARNGRRRLVIDYHIRRRSQREVITQGLEAPWRRGRPSPHAATYGRLPTGRFRRRIWTRSWRPAAGPRLHRRYPPEPIEDPIGEAFAFAQATARLAGDPAALQRLAGAVARGDAETFGTLVAELELSRFCIQLCHWLCRLICRRSLRHQLIPDRRPGRAGASGARARRAVRPPSGLRRGGIREPRSRPRRGPHGARRSGRGRGRGLWSGGRAGRTGRGPGRR